MTGFAVLLECVGEIYAYYIPTNMQLSTKHCVSLKIPYFPKVYEVTVISERAFLLKEY